MKNMERRERKDVKNVELRITPKKTADDPAYDDDLFDANDFDSVYASPGRGVSDQTEDGMIYVGLGNIPVKKDAGEAAVRYTYSEILFRLPEKQKELLIAITKEGRAKALTSGTFIKKYKLASASSVQAALKGLLEKDFVTQEMGICQIYDRFLGIWLKENY